MSDMTVREIVDKMYEATQKMSKKNPHRAVMLHGVSTIIQLSKRIDAVTDAELQKTQDENRIILV